MLSTLNPEQRRAVTTLEGPLLIIAGAGSGKTRVITARIAYMLECGILQSRILALTFTNKAAHEMSERIKALTGKPLRNTTVSTFHAFGVTILREHIHVLGWRKNFSIYDENDKRALIREAAKEVHLLPEVLDTNCVSTLFSAIKMQRKNLKELQHKERALWHEYQTALKLFNAVDFDDLIVLPIQIFSEYPDILASYKSRYHYILVDEFQDTSAQQYRLMKMLATQNICVVGDDDQSIYSWRGAHHDNILSFEKDFPYATEITLEQNYRSTGTILAAANGVIAHNTQRKEKALWSGNDSGKPIEIFNPETERDEAIFIANTILAEQIRASYSFSSFGVLLRTNSFMRIIEDVFLQENIPYRVSGGMSFFQRKEIKDVLSYLRVISNPDDDVNLLRIINTPRRGIGKKTLHLVSDIANTQQCSVFNALNQIINKTHAVDLKESHRTAVENFLQLITQARTHLLSGKNLAYKVRKFVEDIQYFNYLIQEFQKNEHAARFKFLQIEHLVESIEHWEQSSEHGSLYDYLNRVTLLARDNVQKETEGAVSLMTIHASKGLEFPVVFIAGVEAGTIPHERSIEEVHSIEEERRLFYVAITRAKEKLYLTHCRTRKRGGKREERTASPFLDEIPKHLVRAHAPEGKISEEEVTRAFTRIKKLFT